MAQITRESLLHLEAYAKHRSDFRARVIAHKNQRRVCLGENLTLCFEDELTMRYQIQEMLRSERVFEDEGIQSELDAYNPLVPSGTNLTATMMIEYTDPEQRQQMLARLKGIEDRVWLQVAGFGRVYAIADEDLERENETKTSAVHFLRFEFDSLQRLALRDGAQLSAGVDHAQYSVSLAVVDSLVVRSLAQDFAE